MSDLQHRTNLVAASLWALSATLEELQQREAFRTISPFGLEMVVDTLLESNQIYLKGERYYCYRSAESAWAEGWAVYIGQEEHLAS